MRRIYQCLCVVIFALLAVSCAKDEVEVTGSINGIVTDATSKGTPIQGATVTLNPTGLKTTTGSDGRYEFQDLEVGQYTVQVLASGYESGTMKVDVVAGKKSIGDISLNPIQTSSKVSLSPTSLNFGLSTSSLTFTMKNTGDKATSWNISGLESWLSVSPSMGTLNAGKSQVVKVMVDRSLLDRTTSTLIVINVDEESLSLPITVEVESENSLLKLNTSRLDFGTDYNELSFQIQNKGNVGAVNWKITEVSAPWVTVSPLTGTTEMGKSSSVKVIVDRTQITEATTTTIFVSAEGESLPLVIAVEPNLGGSRSVRVYPEQIDFGEDKNSEQFSLYSYGGSTDYQLYTEGDASWLSFSEENGTIPEYDSSLETDGYTAIEVHADRSDLAVGNYSCTIVVRTDLGDYRIPVTMTVPSSGTGGGDEPVSGTIESCDSRVDMKLLSVRRSGSTVVCEFSMTNNGPDLSNVDLSNSTNTYAYDNEGGYYTYGMGTYNMTLTLAGSTKGGGTFIRKPFPNGVTLKCEIKFLDVPTSVTSFTNITMYIGTYASSWKFDNEHIVIKNLEI